MLSKNRKMCRVFMPQGGSKAELSHKWGPRVNDPFKAESKNGRLEPPARLMALHMQEKNEDLLRELRHTYGSPMEHTAILSELARQNLPKLQQKQRDAACEQFTLDFMNFLQGKDPESRRDPAYVKHRLKELGQTTHTKPAMGKGIKEWLEGPIRKKAEILRKLTLLRLGPHKAFEWSLDTWWLYYKYILRDLPYPEDEVLHDFDKFWPTTERDRSDKPFKHMGRKGEHTDLSYTGHRTFDDQSWPTRKQKVNVSRGVRSEHDAIVKSSDRKTAGLDPDGKDPLPDGDDDDDYTRHGQARGVTYASGNVDPDQDLDDADDPEADDDNEPDVDMPDVDDATTVVIKQDPDAPPGTPQQVTRSRLGRK